jgi:hypothetical protein
VRDMSYVEKLYEYFMSISESDAEMIEGLSKFFCFVADNHRDSEEEAKEILENVILFKEALEEADRQVLEHPEDFLL